MSSISSGTTSTTGYVVSSDTTGALVLKTGSAATTAVTIDTSQNVGIGTGSPTFLSGGGLEIYNSSVARLKLTNSTTGTASTDGLDIHINSTDANIIVRESFPLIIYTSNAERMRILSGGNVGIGLSNPSAKLEVNPAADSYFTGGLRVNRSNEGTQYGTVTCDGNLVLTSVETAVGAPTIAFRTSTNGTTSAEQMRLTTTGLGIGTSSPDTKLTIKQSMNVYGSSAYAPSSATGQGLNFGNDGGGTEQSWIQALRNNTSETRSLLLNPLGGNVGIGTTSPSARLQLGDGSSGQLKFRIHRGAGTDYTEYFSDTGTTVIDTVGGGNLVFRFSGTEKARIDASGNLLVGTTSITGGALVNFYAASSTIQSTLGNTTSAQNHFVFANPNGNVGTIQVSGSSTSFNTSSDYRLKNTIVRMTGALAKVALLKPCTYKWNCDGSDGQGFIAHELAEVVPECVTGEKDAVDADGNIKSQGVDTSFLVATLTAAIQEQQLLIQQLQADVAILKGGQQ